MHPLSCCGIWHDGDPGAARGAVPPSTAPDEGMLVLVPVRGGPLDGFFDLGPGLEAVPFEGQRAQDLPPRLDQVQVGRVFGLEHELPARVGQSKEQHIGCAVDVEVVHHGVDPRDIGVDPALARAEEIDPVRGGAAGVRGGKGLPRSRSEGTEDIALAASAVVDLLLGPLCFGTAWVLPLKFTGGGYVAGGKAMFDSEGNLWVGDNFTAGWQAHDALWQGNATKFAPNGRPLSPITTGFAGGGMQGGTFGAAVGAKDNAWLSSYGGKSIAVFDKNGKPLTPPEGITFAGKLGLMQGI